MFGLLNVNKPTGMTSRDAVNHVQRLIRPIKVGHAGTLDPLATGVLVLCLGRATRLIQFVQQLSKRYTAEFLLGRQSSTDDVEGDVVELPEVHRPTLQQIQEALPNFIGTIQQRPPAFSAIKVQGKRAYKLAREGQELKLEARPVTIYGIDVLTYDYPELVLDIRCGSGTYIRSIGRDLAEQLDTTAVMSKLVRTSIGEFQLEQACELDQLTCDTLTSLLSPAEEAVAHLPAIQLSEQEIRKTANGMTIVRGGHHITAEAAAFDSAGQLIAVMIPRGPDGLRPACNFAAASAEQTRATS